MIKPDYISQLSPQEKEEVNEALGFALTYGTGIIQYNIGNDHHFSCDPEVTKWVKRVGDDWLN